LLEEGCLDLFSREPRVSLYPVAPVAAARLRRRGGSGGGLIVAFRLEDARRRCGTADGRGRTTVGAGHRGDGADPDGEVTVFGKVVAVAPARVRRDGRVRSRQPGEARERARMEDW